jgi:hypothetical protein
VGLFDLDTVMITVRDTSQPNRPPVANAGSDQIITLPTNTIILDGSASSDSDNNILSYQWRKISGPFSFDISNPNAVQAQVTYLYEGVHMFELTVIDAGGLFDKDTVEIEVKPDTNQRDSVDVIFYWPEPTGTVNFNANNFEAIWMEWDDNTGNYLKLVTIKLDTLSDFLAGVWCQNCPADCNAPYYANLFGDKNIVTFHLPPGTYNWSAETTINAFPVAPSYNPGVTTEFFNYFDTVHKTNGTITVNPGNNCIVEKIDFE